MEREILDEKSLPRCAICSQKYCSKGIKDHPHLPHFCPLKNFKMTIDKVKKRYKSHLIKNFYLCSAITEKESYDEKACREEGKTIPIRPRIREIAEFAKLTKSKRIGMAFCSGLSDEAEKASKILENHGLEICSVICSCGALDKTETGIPERYKINKTKLFESACNPLLQAELLNQAKTDFNILIGLCVGHDMLFTKYSIAPVTTLIVKDRLTGHNPVASLYSKYYRDLV